MEHQHRSDRLVKITHGLRWIVAVALAISAFSGNVMASPQDEPVLIQPEVPRPNVIRLNVGISTYDSGWYNCNYFYPYYACNSGAYTGYAPFTLGVQADIFLGGISNLSPGFQVMTGSANASYFNGVQTISSSSHVTLWEPTLDYVGKPRWFSGDILARFRVGGALYFGSDGNSGGGVRIGGGASFFNDKHIGIGLDFVFEGGSYHGFWLGGLQLLASPEFHF